MLCRKFLADMLILPGQLMAIEVFPSYKYNSLPLERRKWRIFVSVNLPFRRGMFFSTTFQNCEDAIDKTLGLYCMTPDEADGLIRYDEQSKQVFVEWNNEQHQRFYYSAKTGIEEAVKSLDRNVGIQPKWSAQFDSGTYTRHPLGGCPMGESGIYGVVDHTGQVFIGRLHVYH